jgi:hypothetical protein
MQGAEQMWSEVNFGVIGLERTQPKDVAGESLTDQSCALAPADPTLRVRTNAYPRRGIAPRRRQSAWAFPRIEHRWQAHAQTAMGPVMIVAPTPAIETSLLSP